MDVEELGLYDFLQLIRTRRRTLGWTIAAATVMGLLIGILSRPVYRADVVLAPLTTGIDGQALEGLGSSLGGLASLVGLGGKNGASDIEQNIAVLRSRALADHFISQHQLAIILFENRWDKGEGRWKKVAPSPVKVQLSRLLNNLSGDTVRVRPSDGAPTADEIYRAFDKVVRSVDRDEKTGLVTLGMKWHDPIVAATWASEYARAANDYIRAQKISEAERSLKYLEEQIRKTSLTEMHDALYKLVENETKQSMLANVREEFAFRIIDPATAPELRVSPKRAILLGIGLMGGFILGLGIILTQNYFSVMRIARQG